MLPFYAGLALLFHLNVMPVARKLFILFLVALNVSVFYPSPASYASSIGKLRVSVIDVGQGDAIFVEFPDGKTMLVDAGPRAPQYDAGERVVAPFLKRRSVSTIDLLVVSHPDNDHIGGVPTILDQFDVKRVIDSGQPALTKIYRQYLTGIANEQCVHESTRAGTMLKDFPGVRLYFLYPTPTFLTSDTTERNPNLNNTSVVVKLQYGGISFLLAGDVEKEAEAQLVAGYGEFLKSTVLKVGHHGSKTSSTHEFLEAVEPLHAVISVGQYNWFGHPSGVVLQRLEDMNVDISRTDEEGAIIFETDGTVLTQIEWR